MISPLYIPIVGIVAGTAITMTVLAMVNDQLKARRFDGGPRQQLDPEILRRLDRIEQIVDSTAVEVERIAEANRFMSKLLAERSDSANKV